MFVADWKVFFLNFVHSIPQKTNDINMGAYLSTPNIEKHSADDENDLLHCGSSQMQGWRTSQEVNCLRSM